MTAMTRSDGTVEQLHDDTGTGAISRNVDWLVTAILGILGVALVSGGALLMQAVERSRVATWVSDGTITSTELSNAELIDVIVSLGTWGGIGMIVAGAVLLGGGVAFIAFQTRARRLAAGSEMHAPGWITAVVGAVVTAVLTVVPFAPILGGAVAGYLHRGTPGSGARTGALAGLLATIPVGIVFAFLVVGLTVLPGGVVVFVGGMMLLALVLTVAYITALSALGGYLGVAYLQDRDDIAA